MKSRRTKFEAISQESQKILKGLTVSRFLHGEEGLSHELANRTHDSDAFATIFADRILDRLYFRSPGFFVAQPEIERCLVEVDQWNPIGNRLR